ncbi:hypothetical protein [Nocardia sp. CA-290969]|uniref:hypothetical protein n=1 Tax=Nocardia sp. CA-290969 TaxID=3239986 RepID=UPI003D90D95D
MTYSTVSVGDPARKDLRAMKFDVILPGTNHIPGFYPWSHALDADGFRRILRTLDESGFHAVSVSEHLAMPLFEVPRLGSYWQDALSTMAFAAAATDRIVGGNSAPALRRAARHDGWQPNPTDFMLEEIPPLLDYIREQPEYAGKEESFDINWLKSPTGVTLSQGFARATASELNGYRDELIEAYRGRYRKIGITRTVAEPPRGVGSEQEYLDYLCWFTEEVMPEA